MPYLMAQKRPLPADAELTMLVIAPFAAFTGVRLAEIFESLQLHLQPADLLE